MAIKLFAITLLFCGAVGYGLAVNDFTWWSLAAVTIGAVLALNMAYVATSVIHML